MTKKQENSTTSHRMTLDIPKKNFVELMLIAAKKTAEVKGETIFSVPDLVRLSVQDYINNNPISKD